MIRLLTDEDFDHNILRGLIRRVPHLDFVLVHDVGDQSTPIQYYSSGQPANTESS